VVVVTIFLEWKSLKRSGPRDEVSTSGSDACPRRDERLREQLCSQKEERLQDGARPFSTLEDAQIFFLGLQWACRYVEFVAYLGCS